MDRTNPSTAIIREHTRSFGHGCPSVTVVSYALCRGLDEQPKFYNWRHAKITKVLLLKQITSLKLEADALIVADKTS